MLTKATLTTALEALNTCASAAEAFAADVDKELSARTTAGAAASLSRIHASHIRAHLDRAIVAGDVVVLNCGGPDMTVEQVRSTGVLCYWFVGEQMAKHFFSFDVIHKKPEVEA